MKCEYRTKQRNAILEFLKDHADVRLTAHDIIKAIRVDGEEPDRSTVYRNLERLCKEGLLVKYKESDIKAACYRYSEEHGSCHDHMHAQCSGCGKIFHLENEIMDEAASKMRSEYAIEIDYGRTVLIGVCDECKEKKNK